MLLLSITLRVSAREKGREVLLYVESDRLAIREDFAVFVPLTAVLGRRIGIRDLLRWFDARMQAIEGGSSDCWAY